MKKACAIVFINLFAFLLVNAEDFIKQAIYSEYSGGHTWPVWRNNLYNFAQLLFK